MLIQDDEVSIKILRAVVAVVIISFYGATLIIPTKSHTVASPVARHKTVVTKPEPAVDAPPVYTPHVTPTSTPTPTPTPKPQSPAAKPTVRSNNSYPAVWANAPLDSVIDSWGMFNRECTSYAAFKAQQAFGNMPDWTFHAPGIVPDAASWPTLAARDFIPYGPVPKVHSIATLNGGHVLDGHTIGPAGHAMWVEAINPDGTLHVSQYNLLGDGAYSEGDYPSTGMIFIYFGSPKA
jgi:surface antigen